MKFIDKDSWQSRRVVELEEALDTLMCGYSDGGTLEAIQADLDATRRLLAKFMAQSVTTVSQLNGLAGYDRFKEVTG